MNEITPGPWAWRRFGDTYTLHADHGRRECILGAIPHGEMEYPVLAMSIGGRLSDVDTEHPNSRLIEAAPTLLTELELLAERLAEMIDNQYGAAVDDADCARAFALIKKIKGA